MTTAALESYKENYILIVNIPANLPIYYHSLHLTFKSYAKRYMKNKFNSWYSGQVKQQLDSGVSLEDVNVKLQHTTIKALHASWLIEFYNHMSTITGKKIESDRRAAGIIDVLKLGTKQLQSIDPFDDFDPMVTTVDITEQEQFLAIGNPPFEDIDAQC